MSLQDLTPLNSRQARETAVRRFKRFLSSENVQLSFIRASLFGDPSGKVFLKLMDRWALHLAFANGRSGAQLARNTVMSYYRHVKNWLLADFPQHRATIERQLLDMGKTLERYCVKQQGALVKKAPACTKEDLRLLIDGIFSDATSAKDYQDAALLSLMWYAFGRASDLSFVRKCNLSVAADDVLFLRFIRTKTSEEQGITLFPDQGSFVTCPLHAVAIALAMQTFPGTSLLDHPNLVGDDLNEHFEVSSGICLAEALNQCAYEDVSVPSEAGDEDATANASDEISGSRPAKRQSQPGLKIHAYVNRIVKALSERQQRGGLTTGLSSHSFRRGGAQHANSDASLSAQWIFDRGSWNMTTTNKAFAYVFNTTSEDQKVSKVLSGWESADKPAIPSIAVFDSTVRARIRGLGRNLFLSSYCLVDPAMNLDARVLDLLTVTLIKYYPEISERYPSSPYADRMRSCCMALHIKMPEVLAWSNKLYQHCTEMKKSSGDQDTYGPGVSKEIALINHQNIVIGELVNINRDLTERLEALEKQMRTKQQPTIAHDDSVDGCSPGISSPSEEVSKGPKLGKSAPMSAAAIWFEWYTRTPRLWDTNANRQYKSTAKQVVGFMKLFLPNGFELDPTAADYADKVLRLGKEAQALMVEFLRSRGIQSKFGSGLLKKLRELHRQGAMASLIESYRARVAIGKVVDPAPESSHTFF